MALEAAELNSAIGSCGSPSRNGRENPLVEIPDMNREVLAQVELSFFQHLVGPFNGRDVLGMDFGRNPVEILPEPGHEETDGLDGYPAIPDEVQDRVRTGIRLVNPVLGEENPKHLENFPFDAIAEALSILDADGRTVFPRGRADEKQFPRIVGKHGTERTLVRLGNIQLCAGDDEVGSKRRGKTLGQIHDSLLELCIFVLMQKGFLTGSN